MSKPIFEDLLLLNVRRNRASYIWAVILLSLILTVITFVLGALIELLAVLDIHQLTGEILGGVMAAIILSVGAISSVFFFILPMQRCNDIGLPQFLPVLIQVSWVSLGFNSLDPLTYSNSHEFWTSGVNVSSFTVILLFGLFSLFFFLYLVFKSGEDGPNTFGPNPLAETSKPSAEEQVKPKAASMTKEKKTAQKKAPSKKASQKKVAKKTS